MIHDSVACRLTALAALFAANLDKDIPLKTQLLQKLHVIDVKGQAGR